MKSLYIGLILQDLSLQGWKESQEMCVSTGNIWVSVHIISLIIAFIKMTTSAK